MTRNGFTRVNCGIVFMNLYNLDLARRFLSKWAMVSGRLLRAGEETEGELGADSFEEEAKIWKVWQDQLMDDFRGNDQVGIHSEDNLCTFAWMNTNFIQIQYNSVRI